MALFKRHWPEIRKPKIARLILAHTWKLVRDRDTKFNDKKNDKKLIHDAENKKINTDDKYLVKY